jgi:hypothetical protein
MIMTLPAGRGDDPHVCITKASTTPCPAACHAAAFSSNTSFVTSAPLMLSTIWICLFLYHPFVAVSCIIPLICPSWQHQACKKAPQIGLLKMLVSPAKLMMMSMMTMRADLREDKDGENLFQGKWCIH